MRPTPAAHAMIGTALALLLLSVLLSDDALSAPAIAILLFLSFEAWMHALRVRRVLFGIRIAREVKPLVARQGASTGVRTVARLEAVPESMEIGISDLPPAGVEIVGGGGGGQYSAAAGEVAFSYRLKLLGRGKLPFAGISIECRDTFFASVHLLSGDRFSQPCILAIPSGMDAGTPETGGERWESRRRIMPVSQTVREFRRFRAGDDTRRIDWKLSAKRGTLMVREMMGVQAHPVLVLLDLPERLKDQGLFDRLVSSAGAQVERILGDGAALEVCAMSGANLVRIEWIAGSPERWYRLQSELRAGESFVPLIRYSSTTSLEMRARGLKRHLLETMADGDPLSETLNRIVSVLNTNARPSRGIPFERQLHALLQGRTAGEEIVVFTLLQGDVSHLRLLAEAAGRRRLRLRVRTTRMAMRSREAAELGRMGNVRMEAFG